MSNFEEMDISTESGALFSPCGTYRYSLWRNWPDLLPNTKGYAMIVGLNPSTADAVRNDPTIRRCITFAKGWGYSGLCMGNLFAFRATDPEDMMKADDPVGPDNDQVLREMADRAGVVVAAWGVDGAHQGRDGVVRAMLTDLHYLKLTKDGHPGHPLYLPGHLTPRPWS